MRKGQVRRGNTAPEKYRSFYRLAVSVLSTAFIIETSLERMVSLDEAVVKRTWTFRPQKRTGSNVNRMGTPLRWS